MSKYQRDMYLKPTYIPCMQFLNYHHLRYFWMVAREGSLAAAGKILRVSHPTLSAQIHALEEQMGQKLFAKVGRRLQLTDVGRMTYRYADEIFSIGDELVQAIAGRHSRHVKRLAVGIVDVVPKLVVQQLLQPALQLAEPVRLICYEDSFDKLLSELILGSLDVVISDSPIPNGSTTRAFHHLLGSTDVNIFGRPDLVKQHQGDFPQCLDGAPFLLPSDQSALRRDLQQWFAKNNVQPRIVGEFADSALLKVFAAQGAGFFAGPAVVADELCAYYGVEMLGPSAISDIVLPGSGKRKRSPVVSAGQHGTSIGVKERFYLVSLDRKVTEPTVMAISQAARDGLFAQDDRSAL